MTQLSLDPFVGECCKARACPEPVVGSSVKGGGHVCRRHNELEWADGLARSPWRDHREMAARLRMDAAA